MDALVMQDSDASVHSADDKRGVTSSTLWDSLKASMLHLNQVELAMVCDKQDIDGPYIARWLHWVHANAPSQNSNAYFTNNECGP